MRRTEMVREMVEFIEQAMVNSKPMTSKEEVMDELLSKMISLGMVLPQLELGTFIVDGVEVTKYDNGWERE